MPQEAGILHKYYSVSGEYYIYVADLFGVAYYTHPCYNNPLYLLC